MTCGQAKLPLLKAFPAWSSSIPSHDGFNMAAPLQISISLDCAAKLAAIPASEGLAGGTCPVATVDISGGGFQVTDLPEARK